tara:strand:- start:56 stop:1168 length:1113 start_codon:yes stop_codon:yes gene_type:complete
MAKITEILKHNENSLKSSAKHLVDGKGHDMEGHGHTSAIGNIDGIKKIINTKPDGTKTYEVPEAIGGGEAGDAYKNKMIEMFQGGASIEDMAGQGHGTVEGLTKLLEGVERTTTIPGEQTLQDIPSSTEGTPGKDPIPEKSVTEGDYLTAGETREAGKILKLRNKGNKKLKKQATKSLNKMVKQGLDIDKEIAAGNQSVISLLEQSGGYNKDGKLRKGFLGLGGLSDDFVSTSDKVDVKPASSDPRVTNPYVRRPGSAQGVNRNNLDGKIITQEAVPGTEGTAGTSSPTTPAGPDDTVYKKNPNSNQYEPVADPNTTQDEIVATTNLSSQMDTNVTGSTKPNNSYKTNAVSRFKVKGYKMGGFGSKASKK